MRKRIWSILTVLCLCLALVSPQAVAEALSPRGGGGNSVTVNGLVITPMDPGETLERDVDYTVWDRTSPDYPEGKNVNVTIKEAAPDLVISGHGKDLTLTVYAGNQVVLQDLTITRTDRCFLPYTNLHALEIRRGRVKLEGSSRLECQGELNWNVLMVMYGDTSLYGTGTLEIQNNSRYHGLGSTQYSQLKNAAALRDRGDKGIPAAHMQGCYWTAGDNAGNAKPFMVNGENRYGVGTGPYLKMDFSQQLLENSEKLYQVKVGQSISMDMNTLFTGGEGARSYEAEDLPQGLALSPEGLLTGSFAQAGHLSFAVTARDSVGRTNRTTLHWQINDSTGPLDVSGGFELGSPRIPENEVGVYRAGRGTITWEPVLDDQGYLVAGVLTLDNATITGGSNGCLLRITEEQLSPNLDIVLKGKNTLSSTLPDTKGMVLEFIDDVNFNGDGILDISTRGVPYRNRGHIPGSEMNIILAEGGEIRLHNTSGGPAVEIEASWIQLVKNIHDVRHPVFYREAEPGTWNEFHVPACDINGSHAYFANKKGHIYTPIQTLRLGGAFRESDGALVGGVDLLKEKVKGLTYDPATQELTLDNVRLTRPICADGTLTLRLVGENGIFIDQKGAAAVNTDHKHQVNAVGDGHLTVNAVTKGFESTWLGVYDGVSMDFILTDENGEWKLGPDESIRYNLNTPSDYLDIDTEDGATVWRLNEHRVLEFPSSYFKYQSARRLEICLPDDAVKKQNGLSLALFAQYDRKGKMISCETLPIPDVYSTQQDLQKEPPDPRAWKQTLILINSESQEPCCRSYTGMVWPPQ